MTLKTTLQTKLDHLVFTALVEYAPAELRRALALHVRVPEWVNHTQITLNGEVLSCPVENGYALISREWQPGDRLEVRLPFSVSIINGERLGRHILNPGVAAVSYGPQIFCLNDAWNSKTRIHLAKVRISPDLDESFIPRAYGRLEARGSTPENHEETLVFTPLAQVGGTPSGTGRIHSVRSPYYKVWIPTEADR